MKSKKALAIVLAIAMIFGVVSMASAASSVAVNGFADSQDSKQADAIAYLRAFGVLRGDAGTNNVRPGDALTREEFVVMVTRATGTESLAAGLAGYPSNFVDADSISDWAVGAINLATGQGWIRGYEDGSFGPKATLTMAEALTVLVRATGHELTVPTTAIWPIGHIMKANSVGVSKGVTVNANAPITREDMARLTYNSLFTKTAYKDDEGKTQSNGDPLVAAQATVVTGLVTDVAAGDSEISIDLWDDAAKAWAGSPDDYDLADTVTVIGANSLIGLKSLTVRAIQNLDGEVYIIEVQKGTATADTYDKAGGKKDARTMVLTSGKTIKVDTATEFYFNEGTTAVKAADDDALLKILDGSAAVALTKGDEIVATVGTDGIAGEVLVLQLDTKNLIVTGIVEAEDDDPAVLTAYEYDDNSATTADFTVSSVASVTINGEPATANDIKVGDVLDVATDDLDGFVDTTVLKVVVTRNTVTGTVEGNKWALNSDGDYVVTTTLKLADGTTKSYSWLEVQASGAGGATPKSVAVFVLNAAGKVVRNTADAASGQYVKIVSIYSDGTDNYVDVDVAGTTKSYKYTPVATPGTPEAGKLDLSSASLNVVGDLETDANGATKFTAAKGWGDATVQSVSGDYVVLKLDGSGTLIAVQNASVYARASSSSDKAGAHLGTDGLSAGTDRKSVV